MSVIVREYEQQDIFAMMKIWNKVVAAGRAFPQEETLDETQAAKFFAEQTRTAVAADETTGEILGLYILHPNDIGRKAHIANASYAVRSDIRGQGVGRALVSDSFENVAPCGFTGLQFNAVVASNTRAIALYESLGMTRIGTIPGGFKNIEGQLEDMHIYFWQAG